LHRDDDDDDDADVDADGTTSPAEVKIIVGGPHTVDCVEQLAHCVVNV